MKKTAHPWRFAWLLFLRLSLPILLGAVLPSKPAYAQAVRHVEVEATGMGETVDQAREAAWADAIAQVSGSVLDAETVVESDRVVRDKVVTYSDGVIFKSKDLSINRIQGTYVVQVRAIVEVRPPQPRAPKRKIKEETVDGSSLGARIKSLEDRSRRSKAMLTRVLEPFARGDYFQTSPVVEHEPQPKDDQWIVTYSSSVSINRGLYRQAVRRLITALNDMGFPQHMSQATSGADNEVNVRLDRSVQSEKALSLIIVNDFTIYHYEIPESHYDAQVLVGMFQSPRLVAYLALLDKNGIERHVRTSCMGAWVETWCTSIDHTNVRGIRFSERHDGGANLIIADMDFRGSSDFHFSGSRGEFPIGFTFELSPRDAMEIKTVRLTFEALPQGDRSPPAGVRPNAVKAASASAPPSRPSTLNAASADHGAPPHDNVAAGQAPEPEEQDDGRPTTWAIFDGNVNVILPVTQDRRSQYVLGLGMALGVQYRALRVFAFGDVLAARNPYRNNAPEGAFKGTLGGNAGVGLGFSQARPGISGGLFLEGLAGYNLMQGHCEQWSGETSEAKCAQRADNGVRGIMVAARVGLTGGGVSIGASLAHSPSMGISVVPFLNLSFVKPD